ncbi:hypothetical protein RB195_019563 [Necator americanus]|uniref:Uncharacterized protein n=1 Tax=Necator americanus TaxID=51031 RepID=A0ABR1CES5_NECAM
MRNGYFIHAQRNEHIRMHQLRLTGSGSEHDERPKPLSWAGGDEWHGESIEDVVKKTGSVLTPSTPPYFLL